MFRYTKVFFDIFLNLNNLFSGQKRLKFYTLLPTLCILIFHIKKNIVCIMMSCMFYLFSFQDLDKLDMGGLDFWLFKKLSILDWFWTWLQDFFPGPAQLKRDPLNI